MADPCAFCEIAGSSRPFLREWADCVAFRPLNPVVPGHALVIPRVHVANAAENPRVTGAVFAAAAELMRPLDSFNLISSAGKEATQSVFHLHVHVVPRAPGDGLMLPWSKPGVACPICLAPAARREMRMNARYFPPEDAAAGVRATWQCLAFERHSGEGMYLLKEES